MNDNTNSELRPLDAGVTPERDSAPSGIRSDGIAVIGLGYVGLPLSLQFAGSGCRVVGLDIDTVKVTALNRGQSYINHIDSEAIEPLMRPGQFACSTDLSRVRGQRDGGSDHLCADAIEQESGTRHFVCALNGAGNCPPLGRRCIDRS
jgi:hypothetical protein